MNWPIIYNALLAYLLAVTMSAAAFFAWTFANNLRNWIAYRRAPHQYYRAPVDVWPDLILGASLALVFALGAVFVLVALL